MLKIIDNTKDFKEISRAERIDLRSGILKFEDDKNVIAYLSDFIRAILKHTI